MSRSKWKGSFIAKSVIKKIGSNKKIIIWNRNSTIPYGLIGKAAFIHTGKDFIKVLITREKVGFKFGEFAYTRKYTKKANKKKKIKNKK